MNKNEILSIIRTENQISLDFISYCEFVWLDTESVQKLKNSPKETGKIIQNYRLSCKKISLKDFILEIL